MRLYSEQLMPKRERETTSCTSDSHVLSRRDFVARTSLIGAGLVVGPLLWTGCSDQSAEVQHPARVCSRMKQDEDTTARHIESLGNRRWRHEHRG